MGRDRWRLILNVLVLAVAAHSVVLGICLLSFPVWTLKLVGWVYSGSIFWPSQAGLFLIILGVAYGAAVWFRPLLWLLVGSKASAFVFLMAHATWLDAPRLAVLLGCADGLMGLSVAFAAWMLKRAEQAAAQEEQSAPAVACAAAGGAGLDAVLARGEGESAFPEGSPGESAEDGRG